MELASLNLSLDTMLCALLKQLYSASDARVIVYCYGDETMARCVFCAECAELKVQP